jgi:predicted ATPase
MILVTGRRTDFIARERTMRIALCGASGTGKTTLAKWLSEQYGFKLNPVGSRSVSKAMGFDKSYDVDKAGKRTEFQRRLLIEKTTWERDHDSFVTDRTTLDNLAYTTMHAASDVDSETLNQVLKGMRRYTHVIYCPSEVFLNVAGDPNRVSDMTYHTLYDALLFGLLLKYMDEHTTVHWLELKVEGKEERRKWVEAFIANRG